MDSATETQTSCADCGAELTARGGRPAAIASKARYCSNACRQRAYRRRTAMAAHLTAYPGDKAPSSDPPRTVNRASAIDIHHNACAPLQLQSCVPPRLDTFVGRDSEL